MNPDPGLTYRCMWCNFNWPWMTAFMQTCPVCDRATKPLRLDDPDAVMTDAQAKEVLMDHGLSLRVGRRAKVGRKPTKDEITKLYEALDSWAHTRPSWMR